MDRDSDQSELIYISQLEERKRWSKRFGVSEDELREAVDHVGPIADDVERWLKVDRHSKQADRMEERNTARPRS